MAERLVVVGGVALGMVRAVAEMRSAIARAAEIGDADTATECVSQSVCGLEVAHAHKSK
jgi:hypothetical protein